jgi:hypothetical protein
LPNVASGAPTFSHQRTGDLGREALESFTRIVDEELARPD